MKMTKVERLLLALAVCGTLAVGAQAAQEVVYDGDYATVTVTTEQKTITYTDANGVQQTYTYTTVTGTPTVEVNVSGLEYKSENGNTTARYYAWNDDGTLTQVSDASSADVTVWYDSTGSHNCTYDSSKYGAEITSDIVDKTTSDENGGAAVHVRGSYTSASGTIGYGDVTGNIIANHGTSSNTTPYVGGAVSNSVGNASVTGKIGNITGNFVGNYFSTSSAVYGGAIGNYAGGSSSTATIGNIEGSFIGNYVTTTSGAASGGAIANYVSSSGTATIDSINGDFIGNYAKGSSSTYGGAIYNYSSSSGNVIIGDITGDFVGNYATSTGGSNYTAYGGAIVNKTNTGSGAEATINSIDGDFIGNYVEAAGSTYGGAILNEAFGTGTAEIKGDLTSNFIGNYANSTSSSAYGGAIYNNIINSGTVTSGTATLGNITGDFIGNYATGSYGYGGAIYNSGTIGDITGNSFISNTATSSGGAIYNLGTIGDISADFTANTVDGVAESGYAGGGAIYNAGTVGTITGNFISNTSGGDGGAIYNDEGGEITAISGVQIIASTSGSFGGAISNEGTITSIKDSEFVGNYAFSESGDVAGGAIYNSGEISSITGTSFYGSYATTKDGDAAGGVICNDGTIGMLELDSLAYNYVSASGDALGGAIFSEGTITLEVGDVVNNSATSSSDDGNALAAGGAIYIVDSSDDDDAAASSVTINGTVSGNYATTSSGEAAGGAIYAEGADVTVTGDIAGNYAEVSTGYAVGGAIYNADGDVTVTGAVTGNYAKSSSDFAAGGAIWVSISEDSDYIPTVTVDGNMSGNYATGVYAYGGAICSDGADVTVTGDMTGNYAKSSSGEAAGGAIWVGSSEDSEDIPTVTVKGNMSGNYATGVSAAGGAIYNEGGDVTVTGDLIGNYATASTGDALGGAIYTEGSLTLNTETIANNYAKSTSGNAMGGAIYFSAASGDDDGGDVMPERLIAPYAATESDGELTISADLIGNYAEGANAYGGAIYNDGGTVTLTGNIVDNSVTGSGEALGGAIYNAGTVNVNIENDDVVISGNTANGEANFLYATADSVTNFTLTDATLTVADGIKGETGYEVNVEGNGIDATTFYMFESFEDSNFSIGNTTLSTVDGKATTYNVNQFSLTGDINMEADVDMANREMDRFVANNNYGDLSGTLNVSGLNAASDSLEKNIAVYFAETNLMYSVESSVRTFGSPINMYEAFYVQKDDDGIHYDGEVYDISEEGSSLVFSAGDENGGYFVINRTGINPAIMVTPMSLMGAMNAMNLSFGYSFEHSDYFMKLPSKTRLEISEWEKSKKSRKQPKETDATKPEYYNQNEMTMRGAWVKTYASNDNVSYKHGWESRDKMYGAIVGFDSNMHESANGWASVFSGYVGTLGIRQQYDAGHVKQHGGLVGLTESFYKKNFYNAWIVAAGRLKAHQHTELGHDSSSNDTWGIATKFGWNIELADGKYSLLPTFAASYTTVSLENYTNAADVYMSGSGVKAFQLNPNLKFIMNMENGLQPYLTVGEVWTVGNSSSVKADGQELDELELKPYTEYGIGVQKRWANDRDAYVQLLAHSGGTDGFVFNAGVRWNF